MNRLLLSGFWFLLVLCRPVLAGDDLLESRYFPLKIGTEWVYKSTKGSRVIQRVTKHEKIDKILCARIEVEVNGKPKGFEHIFVKKNGLYRKTACGRNLDPPICFLKFPAQRGNIWAVNSSLGEHKINGRFSIDEADVTVPKGIYRAVIASSGNLQAGSQSLPMTCWYVPDIGMVKQKVKVGEKTIVLELEDFRIGDGIATKKIK